MSRPVRYVLALALLFSRDGYAQRTHRPPVAGPSIEFPRESFTLRNGLRVVLSADFAAPLVSVAVSYHVGSTAETPGRTGLAHLFEHMMFTGSGHVAAGQFNSLTQGVGGISNGQTFNDFTTYYETVPANYLETALWLESDRMGFLLDRLDSALFVAQREVVQNERRESTENRPYGRAWEIGMAALYPAPSPYNWPVGGHLVDLQQTQMSDIRGFFRQNYSPRNATLVIVGDFDVGRTRALVTRYFESLSNGAPIQRPHVAVVPLPAEQRLVFEDRVERPQLQIRWPAAPMTSPDRAALVFLASILSEAPTSRLDQRLVTERGVASSVSANYNARETNGDLLVTVSPQGTHTLTELEDGVDSVIATLKREGPSAQEMARTHATREFNFVAGLEAMLGKAGQLVEGVVNFNDPDHFRTYYASLQAVSAADVKRVANPWLTNRRVVLSIVPKGQVEQAARPSASRRVQVKPEGGYRFSEARP